MAATSAPGASPGARRGGAIVVAALAPACLASWIVNLALGPAGFTLFLPLAIALVGVGSLLVVRVRHSVIGWLIFAWGVDVSYCSLIAVWASRAAREHAVVGQVQRWLSWTMPVLWHPGFILFVLAMLLFPDGRLLSRRWAVFAVAAGSFATVLAVLAALAPKALISDYTPGIPAPFVSDAEGWASHAFDALLSFMLVAVLGGVASMIVRWRRASGDDRRQVTAFVLPTSVALLVFAASVLLIGDGRLGVVLLAVLPVSLAVAITRYKLYEIDRIVSRTTAYVLVTAVIVAVYAGSVQLVGLLLPDSGSVAVAVATLAAFAVFTPARRRLQRLVDQRFNRTRYDHEQLVEVFRRRLREAGAAGLDLETDLLDVVDDALHPARASVWIRPAPSAR